VALGGMFFLAKGGAAFLSGSSTVDSDTLAQNVMLTTGQCLIFGVVAVVLGALLLFAF
jgi:hypothetical protein